MLRAVKTLLTLGIMSGTSLDGVDYALCSVGPRVFQLEALWSRPYPKPLRGRLQRAAAGTMNSWDVGQLHHDLGRFYAEGAQFLPHQARRRPQLVGLHGQTIFHRPSKTAPATFQIGEPVYLAKALGAPVISNFRAADLAAGGEGAPLATSFHGRIFAEQGRHVCINNLGGMSNVTSIDWRRGHSPRVRAFDTGPANLLLDLAVHTASKGRRQFDRNGAGAARGKACEDLLQRWLKHPYLFRAPPKSTGREMFGEAFLERATATAGRRRLSHEDLLATLTEFTARSIALNYVRYLRSRPDLVILCGGGARNPVLCAAIERALADVDLTPRLATCEQLGWPAASIEPAAFAWLAWLRCHGCAGNLPETTGATHAVCCGQITDWGEVAIRR